LSRGFGCSDILLLVFLAILLHCFRGWSLVVFVLLQRFLIFTRFGSLLVLLDRCRSDRWNSRNAVGGSCRLRSNGRLDRSNIVVLVLLELLLRLGQRIVQLEPVNFSGPPSRSRVVDGNFDLLLLSATFPFLLASFFRFDESCLGSNQPCN